MKSNRIMWVLVVLVVFATVAITVGTNTGRGQENCQVSAATPTPASPFGDLSKYPTVDYDAPEVVTAIEREQRVIKNKRYDSILDVAKNPNPEAVAEIASDAEPEPSPVPFNESAFIVIGEITNSKAFLSYEHKGIYSEYGLRVESTLKSDKQKFRAGENIVIDRTGGVVLYPSGQKVLYRIDWQDFPVPGNRYLFFLTIDDPENPNYKILTAYQLKDGKVKALDHRPEFKEFNGKSEVEFLKLVMSNRDSQTGIQM